MGALLVAFCGIVGGITIPFYAKTGRLMWQWIGLTASLLAAISGLNAQISFLGAMLLYFPMMVLGMVIGNRVFKQGPPR